MKKIYFLFSLILVLFSATSCKKDWTCVCTSGNVVNSTIIIHDVGKMGAKNVCEGYADQNNANGAHESCSLK